jgi:hypothetical protein
MPDRKPRAIEDERIASAEDDVGIILVLGNPYRARNAGNGDSHAIEQFNVLTTRKLVTPQ